MKLGSRHRLRRQREVLFRFVLTLVLTLVLALGAACRAGALSFDAELERGGASALPYVILRRV